jgi:hypothetical protein
VNLAKAPDTREATMDDESLRFFITDSAPEHDHGLRLLVRHKVHDGRLPHQRIARISSGLGVGETCDACETSITRGQMAKEVALAGGRGARGTVAFHALCFQLWDVERNKPL